MLVVNQLSPLCHLVATAQQGAYSGCQFARNNRFSYTVVATRVEGAGNFVRGQVVDQEQDRRSGKRFHAPQPPTNVYSVSRSSQCANNNEIGSHLVYLADSFVYIRSKHE